MEPTVAKRPRRNLRKGVYIIPSLLTTGNIFAGFYAVISSLRALQLLGEGPENAAAAAEHFDRASIAIGWAVLLDALDGRIARLANAASDFGVEFDSLADVLSFGLAPAVLAFAWGYGGVTELHKLAWAASFMYLICGALRLARFNVQAHKPQKPTEIIPAKLDKKQFVGMPIPAGAGMIAALVHFTPMPVGITPRLVAVGNWNFTITSFAFGVFLIVLVVALGLLMVSTIRHSSFKGAGPHTRNPRLVIVVLGVLIAAVWFYSQWTLLILASLYALHGVVGKLWGMIRRRPTMSVDPSDLNVEEPSPH